MFTVTAAGAVFDSVLHSVLGQVAADPVGSTLLLVLSFAGAGIALAGGVGVVAVHARLGGALSGAAVRRSLVVWAAGALLLATGLPGAARASIAGSGALRALALVGVLAGGALVVAAPLLLWGAALEAETEKANR